MVNIKLTIQYDGTVYDGWQRLGENSAGRSIQGEIEKQLSFILQENVKLIGSGRTDSGVHALGQTANFITNKSIHCYGLRERLNCHLPEEIKVTEVIVVSNKFHSRFFSVSKTYVYYIDNNPETSLFSRKYTYHQPEKLNLERMRKGASYLMGTHDFKGFASSMKDGRPTTKTIHELTVEMVDCFPLSSVKNRIKQEKFIAIKVRADGFLYNMVRIIAGTLIEIGLGIKEPKCIHTILENKERSEAGFTAEPQGLFLKEVEYP